MVSPVEFTMKAARWVRLRRADDGDDPPFTSPWMRTDSWLSPTFRVAAGAPVDPSVATTETPTPTPRANETGITRIRGARDAFLITQIVGLEGGVEFLIGCTCRRGYGVGSAGTAYPPLVYAAQACDYGTATAATSQAASTAQYNQRNARSCSTGQTDLRRFM